MLDPNRYSLDAATVGFRKRMGLSVNWGNFNEAVQVQTEAIKVRRELEETPISEIHVMGGQGLGIAGNGKTNELARQSRQMNGYPLRSFYATGGAVVVPGKHGEGLLATPQNVGLTSYAQYNGVVGNYVSSFTEPLNAPMDSNIMLLARTGAQLRNESISNPYKVLQFQMNMNSSLEQIQANEKRHQELRGYNQESLARDVLQMGSAYGGVETADILRRKRNGAAALIGDSASSQPGSGTAILAGSEAPGVQTKSRKKQKLRGQKVSPEQEQDILEYVSTIMPLEEAELEAATDVAEGLQDLQTNEYANPETPSLIDRIQQLEERLQSRNATPYDPVANKEAETKTDGYVDNITPKTPIRNITRGASSKEGFMKPRSLLKKYTARQEEIDSLAGQLSARFYGLDAAEAAGMIDAVGYDDALAHYKNLFGPDKKTLSVEMGRNYQLNEALLGNTLANSLLDQQLSQTEAVPLEKSDDLYRGPTGTFANPVEQSSVLTNKVFEKASTTPYGMDIASGAPNSRPNAGTLSSLQAKSTDGSSLVQQELFQVVGKKGKTEKKMTPREKQAAALAAFEQRESNKGSKTPQSITMTEFMSGNRSGPSPTSRVISSGNKPSKTPIKPVNLSEETLISPKGNKIKINVPK